MTGEVLPASVYESLLEFTQRMHACRSARQLESCIAEHASSVIPADLVAFNAIDTAGNMGGTRVVVCPDNDLTSQIVPLFDKYLHQHPLVRNVLETGDGRPKRITDLVSIDEFRKTELFQSVFVPLGVVYQVAFTVNTVPGMVIGVALNRADSDFSDAEVRIAQLMFEHIPPAFHHVQLSEIHEREQKLGHTTSLSDREREILVYLRAGMSNTDIARSLMLGRRTVEKHLERIYSKLGVANRTAAVTTVWPMTTGSTPAE